MLESIVRSFISCPSDASFEWMPQSVYDVRKTALDRDTVKLVIEVKFSLIH